MIDHFVYGVPDLEDAMDDFENKLGFRPMFGGAHKGFGTHNALFALDNKSYFEIIAPDPNQDPMSSGHDLSIKSLFHQDGARLFGLDKIKKPKIITWAIRVSHIEKKVSDARNLGFDFGEVKSMTRVKSDGTSLSWKLTFKEDFEGGIVPFLIEWKDVHPSESMPKKCFLISLELRHKEPKLILPIFDFLNITPKLKKGENKITVCLDTPNGKLKL